VPVFGLKFRRQAARTGAGISIAGGAEFSIARVKEFPAGRNVKSIRVEQRAAMPAQEELSMRKLAVCLAIGVMSAAAFIAQPAAAESVALKADLKAANEVPPNSSTATGQAEATFDTATRNLTWTVTYSGLSGPAAGAHFHGPGEAGKNAGIVLPFPSPSSPIKGSQVLTEAQAADLLAGKWYVNIHTAANPGGEIRGQMVK
jgi:hypothetical protein